MRPTVVKRNNASSLFHFLVAADFISVSPGESKKFVCLADELLGRSCLPC